MRACLRMRSTFFARLTRQSLCLHEALATVVVTSETREAWFVSFFHRRESGSPPCIPYFSGTARIYTFCAFIRHREVLLTPMLSAAFALVYPR